MKIGILTNLPAFAPDLADEARVFFGAPEIVYGESGDITLSHTEEDQGARRVSRAVVSGRVFGEGESAQEAVCSDPVKDKRLRKRAVKLAAYEALKKATGFAPPWGSLTGIRPTRLVYAAMEKGLSAKDASRELISRFDVTEAKARLLQAVVETQTTLPKPSDTDVDIYAGIPFCASRCAYCSFLSAEVGKGDQLLPYVEALEKEAALCMPYLENRSLRAFYMGGGTPTALPPALLRRALNALAPYRAPEATVEAGRPDTITMEKLHIIRDFGASRVSVNPQTFHDETLRRIGRNHTAAQTEAAFFLAREAGFRHINMDVILGLPGETPEMFRQTLDWVYSLRPESVTVHALCIKRASLLHLWRAALPDPAAAREMAAAGEEYAARYGLRPYYLYRQKHMAGDQENVAYASPGNECLYNVDMMEETASVLAFGAGASSKRVMRADEQIKRAFNVSDVSHYIARVEEMAQRKQELFG